MYYSVNYNKSGLSQIYKLQLHLKTHQINKINILFIKYWTSVSVHDIQHKGGHSLYWDEPWTKKC